jgi:hypothetical protein
MMVAIPVKNDAEWLRACLDTLLRMDYPHEKLRFVFGYGQSIDDTRRIIEETFAAADVAYEILDEPESRRPIKNALYLADIMNFLQDQLRDEDYVLYVDADVIEVPKNALRELILTDRDIVAPCPMIETKAGRLVFYDTYVFRDLQGRKFKAVQRNPNHPWLRRTEPVEMMSVGTMALVKRKAAEQVRWANPVPFLQYCLDARSKGFSVWALPFLRVRHANIPYDSTRHASLEEYVKRGVLPASELKKIQTLRGLLRLQESLISHAKNLRRFLVLKVMARHRATANLIPPYRAQVREFREIARQSMNLTNSGRSQGKAKTVLYLGTHPMLTYEECSLLHELGCTVVNISPMHDVALAERSGRQYVPADFEYWLKRAKDRFEPHQFDQLRSFNYGTPPPPDLAELIEREIDTIIVVHDRTWIRNLIRFSSYKRFIVRLVQHHHWYVPGLFNDFFSFPNFFICPDTEQEKAMTPDIVSRLTVLPCHVDERRLRPYIGDIPGVMTAASNMVCYPKENRVEEYKRCVDGFPSILTGFGNAGCQNAMLLDYQGYIDALARYRAHLNNGYGRTSNYALKGFVIESMLCGAPVVTLSNKTLCQIFDNSTNGFCSDNIRHLRTKTKELLEDLNYAMYIGQNGQKLARKLWSKDRAKKCWQFVLSHSRDDSIAWLREERRALELP